MRVLIDFEIGKLNGKDLLVSARGKVESASYALGLEVSSIQSSLIDPSEFIAFGSIEQNNLLPILEMLKKDEKDELRNFLYEEEIPNNSLKIKGGAYGRVVEWLLSKGIL